MIECDIHRAITLSCVHTSLVLTNPLPTSSPNMAVFVTESALLTIQSRNPSSISFRTPVQHQHISDSKLSHPNMIFNALPLHLLALKSHVPALNWWTQSRSWVQKYPVASSPVQTHMKPHSQCFPITIKPNKNNRYTNILLQTYPFRYAMLHRRLNIWLVDWCQCTHLLSIHLIVCSTKEKNMRPTMETF